MREAGIGTSAVSGRDRCTTRKLRVVTTRNQQVARVDYECDRPAAGEIEAALARQIRGAVARADVVLISDYQKGTITEDRAGGDRGGAARGVPSLVDPKVPHIDYYAGASLVTPNHHEAEAVTLQRIRTTAEARTAARGFASARGARACSSPAGSTACGCSARRRIRPAGGDPRSVGRHRRRRHRDRRDGARPGRRRLAPDAARLANRAAGLAVARFGPVAISAEEVAAALYHFSTASRPARKRRETQSSLRRTEAACCVRLS